MHLALAFLGSMAWQLWQPLWQPLSRGLHGLKMQVAKCSFGRGAEAGSHASSLRKAERRSGR